MSGGRQVHLILYVPTVRKLAKTHPMSIIAQQCLYRPNSELYNTQTNVRIPLLKA